VPVFFRRQRSAANIPSMLAYVAMGIARGRRLVRSEPFDIINTHFALPTGPVGQLVGRAAGIPNVLSVHGGDLYDPSKRTSAHRHALLRACVRRLALSADAVVAQSQDTQANLHRFFAPEVRAHVIPLGIDEPPLVTAVRADYGFEARDVLLISVGRLVRRKNVEQLLDVVARLNDRRVKLVLVGDGPRGAEVRERAKQLGIESQVRFVGMVDEKTKFDLLAIADLYVSASQHEGFGLVFLEAMASGRPVICYDRGGQRDFLEHGRTGYLAPVNDLASLIEQCRSLIESKDRRAAIGAANRLEARRFFIERCAQQYEALFENVLRVPARNSLGSEIAQRAAEEDLDPEVAGGEATGSAK
jgi:glycosyltransferase involved in cell wall biosynthesis